jgi:hypothetical protein
MVERYEIEVRVGQYGLPYVEPIEGAKLSVRQHGQQFTIVGNAEGLLFLARNLVALATMRAVPGSEGYHIHLDDLYALNEDGVELILRKEG